MKQNLTSILLIDDDQATNFLHRIILGNANCKFQIIAKETAVEALHYLTALKKNISAYPDLIFLDINMPGMDGWEFLRIHKEIEKDLQNKPIIIMLTSSVSQSDQLKALNVGVSEFHPKPLTEEIVKSIIAKYLGDQCTPGKSVQEYG